MVPSPDIPDLLSCELQAPMAAWIDEYTAVVSAVAKYVHLEINYM